MARDHAFARSLDGTSHLWDNPAKALWASIRHDIPAGWRVSGESLYARRSVAYTDLPGWFVVFGVWNDLDELISWDETAEWAELLGLPLAPVLYRGADFSAAIAAWSAQRDRGTSEGFVMRDSRSFHGRDFATRVAKWVRADHVQTSASWRQRDDFDLNEMEQQ